MMGKKEECAETVQKKNFTDVLCGCQCRYYRRRFHGRRQQCLYQSVVRGDHDRIEIGRMQQYSGRLSAACRSGISGDDRKLCNGWT